MRWIALLVLCACGRIGFDPLGAGDGGSGESRIDGPPASGMLLHFTFDTMLLREEYGHDATCTACPLPVVGHGGGGFAASFDGTKCLLVPGSGSIMPPAFTFALWAQTTGSQYGTAFARPLFGAVMVEDTFEFYVDNFGNWNLGTNASYIGAGVAQNQWHHVAVTSDGTGYVAYIDGAQIGYNDVTGPAQYGIDDILIGCDLNASVYNDNFTGIVDDIRIYDGILTADQIATLAM